jgi:hypothetical protein
VTCSSCGRIIIAPIARQRGALRSSASPVSLNEHDELFKQIPAMATAEQVTRPARYGDRKRERRHVRVRDWA